MRDKNPHYWEQEDKVDEQGRGRAQLACRKPWIIFLHIFKKNFCSPQHFLSPTPPWALSLRGENAWWPPVRSRSLSPPSSWSSFQTISNNFKTLKPSKLSTTLKTFLMSSPPHKAPVGTYKACCVAADLRKIKVLTNTLAKDVQANLRTLSRVGSARAAGDPIMKSATSITDIW